VGRSSEQKGVVGGKKRWVGSSSEWEEVGVGGGSE